MSDKSQHEDPPASVFVTVGTTSFDNLIHTLIYDDDVLQVSISKTLSLIDLVSRFMFGLPYFIALLELIKSYRDSRINNEIYNETISSENETMRSKNETWEGRVGSGGIYQALKVCKLTNQNLFIQSDQKYFISIFQTFRTKFMQLVGLSFHKPKCLLRSILTTCGG